MKCLAWIAVVSIALILPACAEKKPEPVADSASTREPSSSESGVREPIPLSGSTPRSTGDPEIGTSGYDPYAPPPGDVYNDGTSSPPGGSSQKTIGRSRGEEPLTPRGGGKASAKSSGKAGGRTYVVRKGDTLSEIAQKMYGDGDKWEKIYNANKSRVKDPKKLKVGTKLVIP